MGEDIRRSNITDVFLFTRDLRLYDNTGLINAVKKSDKDVKCIFVFNGKQIGKNNKYRSDNSIHFMIESLLDLDKSVKDKKGNISFLYDNNGDFKELCSALHECNSVSGTLHMSNDYTPFSEKRINILRKQLKKIGWELQTYNDHVLTPCSLTIRSGSGKMYTTFKPFYDKVMKSVISSPKNIPRNTRLSSYILSNEVSIEDILKKLPNERISPGRIVKGGRVKGLRQLRLSRRRITPKAYFIRRHNLDYETTHLSAYHHFGCISVRESWKTFEGNTALRRQLIWRDFAYHRMVAWPDSEWDSVTDIGKDIKWRHDKELENAWKTGNTGVPTVDAAMRQLKTEGYIHNRGRMVVANYLVKNLRLDWRIGEQYFSQWLTDYDWSVNFMNWVGIAGLLPTDQPLRTMNPFIQAKKNDPDLIYIRKYVPELRDANDRDIFKQDRDYEIITKDGKQKYPKPIIDYEHSRLDYREWAKKHLLEFEP